MFLARECTIICGAPKAQEEKLGNAAKEKRLNTSCGYHFPFGDTRSSSGAPLSECIRVFLNAFVVAHLFHTGPFIWDTVVSVAALTTQSRSLTCPQHEVYAGGLASKSDVRVPILRVRKQENWNPQGHPLWLYIGAQWSMSLLWPVHIGAGKER